VTDRPVTGWQKTPHDAYHALPHLSSSGIKEILRSPLHYKTRFLDGVAREDSAALRLGRYVHQAVFEPEVWRQAATYPEFNLRTKEGKTARAEWLALHAAGVLFVDEEERALTDAISASVLSHPTARDLISGGIAETAGFFQAYGGTAERGIVIPSRICPDYRWVDDGVLVDLKTCEDASSAGFRNALGRYHYDVQAAWYLDGANAIEATAGSELRYDTFVFIAVEKKPPYADAIYETDRETIELGRRTYRRALDALVAAVQTGVWPGYPAVAQLIGAPSWRFSE